MSLLDPEAQDFLNRLASANVPTLDQLGVEQARTQMKISTTFLGRPPRVARIEDLKIPGPGGELPIRIVVPVALEEQTAPIVLFFHGGGWVVGDLGSHESLCRALANASGAVVASVGYRLAPEHRYPAAADDAYAALEWFSQHAGELGCDPSRIAVCGDSAGANLATVAVMIARDRRTPIPLMQVLAYPVVDFDPETESYRRFAEGYYLSRSEMLWYWDQYVPSPASRLEPYASPLRSDDMSRLSPALILTAGYDVLRDEGERYAEALAAAGTPATLSRYEGMIHGFVRRYPFFSEGRRALDEIAEALRAAFGLKGSSRGVDGAG